MTLPRSPPTARVLIPSHAPSQRVNKNTKNLQCIRGEGSVSTYEDLVRRPVRCFFVGRRFVGVAALELAAGVASWTKDGAVGELFSISSCVLLADLVVRAPRFRLRFGAGVLADLRRCTMGEDAFADPALPLMSDPRM